MKKYTILIALPLALLFLSCHTYQASGLEDKTKEALLKQQEISALISKAELCDAKAQCKLGILYLKGLSVKQNYTTALELFTKSAEQGDAGGQYNLGDMYYVGLGTKQDRAKAFELYTKSAEQGYADAQYSMGIMYFMGIGVKQDYTKGDEWNERSWREDINTDG